MTTGAGSGWAMGVGVVAFGLGVAMVLLANGESVAADAGRELIAESPLKGLQRLDLRVARARFGIGDEQGGDAGEGCAQAWARDAGLDSDMCHLETSVVVCPRFPPLRSG